MRPGHFAALLARARGQVTGIRPHAAARYAWEDAASEAAMAPQTIPRVSLPSAPPQPSARTQTRTTAPSALPAVAAPPTTPAEISHTESPDRPEPQVQQPAQRSAPHPVGAGLPAITASVPAGHIAGKPAPTPPPALAPAPASTAPASTAPSPDVTARPQRPTHPPAIGQTRDPRPTVTDAPAEVHLHIGRIEVIAPAPPPSTAGHAEPRRPAQRPLSLDDYLAGRRSP